MTSSTVGQSSPTKTPTRLGRARMRWARRPIGARIPDDRLISTRWSTLQGRRFASARPQEMAAPGHPATLLPPRRPLLHSSDLGAFTRCLTAFRQLSSRVCRQDSFAPFEDREIFWRLCFLFFQLPRQWSSLPLGSPWAAGPVQGGIVEFASVLRACCGGGSANVQVRAGDTARAPSPMPTPWSKPACPAERPAHPLRPACEPVLRLLVTGSTRAHRFDDGIKAVNPTGRLRVTPTRLSAWTGGPGPPSTFLPRYTTPSRPGRRCLRPSGSATPRPSARMTSSPACPAPASADLAWLHAAAQRSLPLTFASTDRRLSYENPNRSLDAHRGPDGGRRPPVSAAGPWRQTTPSRSRSIWPRFGPELFDLSSAPGQGDAGSLTPPHWPSSPRPPTSDLYHCSKKPFLTGFRRPRLSERPAVTVMLGDSPYTPSALEIVTSALSCRDRCELADPGPVLRRGSLEDSARRSGTYGSPRPPAAAQLGAGAWSSADLSGSGPP